jgi:hypothetical protein
LADIGAGQIISSISDQLELASGVHDAIGEGLSARASFTSNRQDGRILNIRILHFKHLGADVLKLTLKEQTRVIHTEFRHC